jgi:glucokinase
MPHNHATRDILNSHCAIGMDVGGTKIAAGLVQSDGKVLTHEVIPTQPERGGYAVAQDAHQLATRLMQHAQDIGLQPVGIGLSVCELVSRERRIVSEATLDWQQLELHALFSDLAPLVIEADSRAAAVCEALFGAGRNREVFLYVTIGTGIGCALVIGGRPFLGATGRTGTMASGSSSILCHFCGTDSSAVLEQIGSGTAIATRYHSQTHSTTHPSAQHILTAAHAGDVTAQQVVITAADSVGSAIAMLVGTLDPESVVIGGGLGTAPGLYWDTLTRSIRQRIWCEEQKQLEIVQATCGPLSAMIGAATIACLTH